ncbi:MAG: radical SAM protein [Lachnospiraceae bacterium]|nr:radical SAM protein [Lachnospiraceae bacterium]
MEQQNVPMQPQVRRYLYQKAAQNRTPVSGTFELTPRCNMNCRMCYIRMSEQEMRLRGREYTADEWIRMGQICAERGMLFLLLTGGEPFLRKDFRKIYAELKKLGLLISINTNGTLIDREMVEWLKKDPPMKVNITLYGGGNETYKKLCGHPTGYDAATNAIDMLKEAGIFVNINASFTRYNLEDMEEIYAFAKSRGIQVNAATYMFPPVRSAREGVPNEEVRFTPEEAGKARARAEICSMDRDMLLKRLKSLHEGRSEFMQDEEECERTPDEKMGCMAGRSSFWITWDGRMTPCGMMNEPVTRPFEEEFDLSWKKITEQTDEILLPPECRECKKRFACMICGALAVAEGHGCSYKKPEYLCRQTEVFLEEMEKEYQKMLTESE